MDFTFADFFLHLTTFKQWTEMFLTFKQNVWIFETPAQFSFLWTSLMKSWQPIYQKQRLHFSWQSKNVSFSCSVAKSVIHQLSSYLTLRPDHIWNQHQGQLNIYFLNVKRERCHNPNIPHCHFTFLSDVRLKSLLAC